MIPTVFAIPAFIFGVVLLYKGSDILVDGTAKIAIHLGLSSLIISVILVGFGTSSPEFAISVGAAIQGESDISVGNIIGSCIANLLLVLGISSIVRPITIKQSILKRELPIVTIAVFIFFLVSYFGLLDNYHLFGGVLFLIIFAVFLYYFYCCAKKERVKVENVEDSSIGKNLIFVVLGIVFVVLGAYLLIESAIAIANFFGIAKIIIALSIVAIGTSLPELVVSAMAAYKKESDIAVGNVLGSNVFNIFLILGFSALFIPLNAANNMDHLILLLVVTLLMYPILFTGKVISRKEGAVMLIFYSFFMWYVFFL